MKKLTKKEKIARRRASSLAWYRKNKSRKRDTLRAWVAKNREKANTYSREWCRRNKEKVQALSKARYKKDPERAKARVTAWKHANPELTKRYSKRGHWKTQYGLSEKDIIQMLKRQKDLCAICKKQITILSCWVDHILARVNGGTNKKRNLHLVCKPCGIGKWTMSIKEYAQHCLCVAKAQGLV